MVHLKDKIKLEQIPITLLNLSQNVIQVGIHALTGSLKLYTDYHET